ncbi:MAG: response regulator [Planctomycetes bacterium]|nr:response regulator [Planctomycetota bacterium]MBI3847614.1 response regulator [Planctomycetota bacterium]
MEIKILSVCDDPIVSVRTEKALAASGRSVFSCRSGTSGLCAALIVSPNIVIVRVAEPDTAALSTARTLAWVHRVPIVCIGPPASPSLLRALEDIPFVACVVVEPWSRDELRCAVDSAIEEVRAGV